MSNFQAGAHTCTYSLILMLCGAAALSGRIVSGMRHHCKQVLFFSAALFIHSHRVHLEGTLSRPQLYIEKQGT